MTDATANARAWARDLSTLQPKLLAWLATKVKHPQLTIDPRTLTAGMSSETILFDLEFDSEGEGERQ